jgi:hypothetical protein
MIARTANLTTLGRKGIISRTPPRDRNGGVTRVAGSPVRDLNRGKSKRASASLRASAGLSLPNLYLATLPAGRSAGRGLPSMSLCRRCGCFGSPFRAASVVGKPRALPKKGMMPKKQGWFALKMGWPGIGVRPVGDFPKVGAIGWTDRRRPRPEPGTRNPGKGPRPCRCLGCDFCQEAAQVVGNSKSLWVW